MAYAPKLVVIVSFDFIALEIKQAAYDFCRVCKSLSLLTSFFNKNMVIILFITIAITNILKNGTNIVSYNEGMCGGACGCNNMISNN